ncbi:TfuA-like protein [Streptomyces sp. NPDC099088]|uniref:TfuA-like protein n=1 Tax=Streptomyces sp. NPDC099088 TaxID=3366101 RepID=UPI003821284F
MELDVRRGDVVLIVDGYFLTRPAVRHKEILDLLHRGVRVHGAASLGALRAAELHAFGMVGHGEVFQAYQNGDIVGDDEVAVLHTEAEDGFRPLTEALVSFRRNLRAATRAQVCTPAVAEGVLREAKNLTFSRRTMEAICRQAVQAGIKPAAVTALREFCAMHGEDVKRQDASRVLSDLAALAAPLHTQAVAEWNLNRTLYLRGWRSPEPDWLALCRLFAEDYPQFHEATALQDLARRAGHVERPPRVPSSDEILDRVLSYLASSGLLDIQSCSANHKAWLTATEQALPVNQRLGKLIARAMYQERSRLWHDPILQAAQTLPVVESARRVSGDIRGQQQSPSPCINEEVDPQRVIDWFQRRWNVEASDFPAAARARGFDTLRSFLRAARKSYLYDRHRQLIHLRMVA